MFALSDYILSDTDMVSDSEHAPWYGSGLFSKVRWNKLEESLPDDVTLIPPVVDPSQNYVRSNLRVDVVTRKGVNIKFNKELLKRRNIRRESIWLQKWWNHALQTWLEEILILVTT